MAALRPCPLSGHVAVGARRLRIISRHSSLHHGTAAAPSLRHRHAIGAQRGGADWPFGVEPGDTRMVTRICLQLPVLIMP